ncbi:carboxypeptidase M32 [Listeria costaricensis]|uniref:carboxypeptidase M32 n=1 Tax=Listeria costaricensis TaxID=2026604 RepID=UPI000C07FACE|nr:carboxypeptidase M32 [Listeria costaricensis]
MAETLSELKQEFLDFVRKIEAKKEALELVGWDIRTGAPKKGLDQRAEVISVLSAEIFEAETSEEMAAFIAALSPYKAELDEITAKTLHECQKEYDLSKKIPAKEYRAYTKLVAQAENAWTEARAENDFAKFEPYLTEIVAMKRQFIEYWGYEENRYDTLLDQYEPGMTVQIVDRVFATLRKGIKALRLKIEQEGIRPDASLLGLYRMPKEEQKQLGLSVLEKMGFDFEAGRLDDTVHPFASGLNPGDVRITTRYDEDSFKMALFGIIHEGGHAIYEQNIDWQLVGTPLANGASMGIHESQSLFYEIILGSSFAFWKSNYPAVQKMAKGAYETVSVEDFYRALNLTESSLIRIEADILTYPLHIMIRYELEKALMNGELEVKDLPQAWGDMYEAYLGVRPETDSTGVLQDIHWAGGDFGYFPSYALGLVYAAQFFEQMKKDLPDLEAVLAGTDYRPIKDWLTQHIHRYGKLKTPIELLKEATGEPINPSYLLHLLEERYAFVYQLKN